ncbi:MAG TPA: endonuclease/exonuclease/phosphatase family protein [Polyangia bacterium]|nr:endonuclease/exonuclease/phosphatase family protein [Polyangia bacterium]
MLVLATGAGCGGDGDGPRTPVKVMTYNIYLGSDLGRLVTTTTPEGIPATSAYIYGNVLASDFPERAKVLATMITTAAPHLVGLQEVSLYRKQVPSDFVPGTTTPNATEVVLDFLALLTREIEDRGGHYRVVNETMNADAELPVDAGNGDLFDLRLTDRDVILAREDVVVTDPTAATFVNRVMLPVGGPDGVLVSFARGYATVTATVDGVSFTFGNSHLEVGQAEAIQIEQAKEVLAGLRTITGPLILVGDFNSPQKAGATNSYALLTQEFRDAYTDTRGRDPGLTCCQADNLKNPMSQASERIDLVLHRGGIRAQDAVVVGTEPTTGKTESGLWASDHFGLTATLGLKP